MADGWVQLDEEELRPGGGVIIALDDDEDVDGDDWDDDDWDDDDDDLDDEDDDLDEEEDDDWEDWSDDDEEDEPFGRRSRPGQTVWD
jgi:hypothetical protein